ncbi:hypothetical protein C8R31_10297 [Nitrosospira sp. Nsp2]|uniref:hypothetical protein n=1 Tax=Nitrosospira sp. Nsp2 TaxID=136548 RepID=UPI000D2FBF01|nr:hypothetical protein [Nitrosospira sp. Nsp2]PTR16083.1 hypothetical protein C8R31_10297 [Nitrosospira sp. Nsp2]
MTLGLFLDLFALVVGLGSGVAFSMGVLRIKDASLDVIAVAFYDSGAAVAKELAQQKTDFVFGSVLLFFSFALQFSSKAITGLDEVVLPFARMYGVSLSLVLASALLFLCYLLWCDLSRKRMERITNLIKENG